MVIPKTIVTLYYEGLKTYIPQPTTIDEIRNNEIEVLRGTLEKKSEIHGSYVFELK